MIPFEFQKALPGRKCSWKFHAVPFSEAEAWSEKPENKGWEPMGNPVFVPSQLIEYDENGQMRKVFHLATITDYVWVFFKKRECR